MTSSSASRVVLVCGGLEAAFVLAQAKSAGRSEGDVVRSLWAIGALTLGLSIFADFVPEVAGPFALLVLVAMAARSRGELGEVLGIGAKPAPANARGLGGPFTRGGGARSSNPASGGGGGGAY